MASSSTPKQLSVALLGATGLVVRVPTAPSLHPHLTNSSPSQGGHILTELLAHPSVTSITTITRRPLPHTSPKLHSIVSSDTAAWPTELFAEPNKIDVLFSGLGTTRAAAGSLEKQREIEHGTNVAVASAARAAGVASYVLISSNGANPHAWLPYMKLKGDIEHDAALHWDSAWGAAPSTAKDESEQKKWSGKTVVARPALILGDRGAAKRFGEHQMVGLTKLVGKFSSGVANALGQEAEWIARAAVRAGLGEVWPEGNKRDAWIMTGADIVKFGKKTEAEAEASK